MERPDDLAAVLARAVPDVDVAAVMAEAASDGAKTRLREATEAAIAVGVFGVYVPLRGVRAPGHQAHALGCWVAAALLGRRSRSATRSTGALTRRRQSRPTCSRGATSRASTASTAARSVRGTPSDGVPSAGPAWAPRPPDCPAPSRPPVRLIACCSTYMLQTRARAPPAVRSAPRQRPALRGSGRTHSAAPESPTRE